MDYIFVVVFFYEDVFIEFFFGWINGVFVIFRFI